MPSFLLSVWNLFFFFKHKSNTSLARSSHSLGFGNSDRSLRLLTVHSITSLFWLLPKCRSFKSVLLSSSFIAHSSFQLLVLWDVASVSGQLLAFAHSLQIVTLQIPVRSPSPFPIPAQPQLPVPMSWNPETLPQSLTPTISIPVMIRMFPGSTAVVGLLSLVPLLEMSK